MVVLLGGLPPTKTAVFERLAKHVDRPEWQARLLIRGSYVTHGVGD